MQMHKGIKQHCAFNNSRSFALEDCKGEAGKAGCRGLRKALVCHDDKVELDSACNTETFKGFKAGQQQNQSVF